VLSGDEVLPYLPVKEAVRSGLPALLEGATEAGSEWSERDLLYKVLFDLKRDMVEMKRAMGQIMESDGVVHSDTISSVATPVVTPVVNAMVNAASRYEEHAEVVDVEENLSLAEVEKRMIERAIRKYAGRRRQAATELGISERTLYRKIKEYGLEED
jgi:DNA-binding protein Fis